MRTTTPHMYGLSLIRFFAGKIVFFRSIRNGVSFKKNFMRAEWKQWSFIEILDVFVEAYIT